MGADSTLTTVGLIAAAGKMGRPTVTECAPGPKVKAPTPAAGISASRCPASTPGLGETTIVDIDYLICARP